MLAGRRSGESWNHAENLKLRPTMRSMMRGSRLLTLDLRISYKNGYGGWSVALLLHNERVDGIDFEARYTAMDGQSCSGWHRHCWNEEAKEAKTQKRPLAALDGVDNIEDFLIRIFAALRIRLNQEDHGTYELFST
jgi:hypothetical protein